MHYQIQITWNTSCYRKAGESPNKGGEIDALDYWLNGFSFIWDCPHVHSHYGRKGG